MSDKNIPATALLERVAQVMGWEIVCGHFSVKQKEPTWRFPVPVGAVRDLGTNTPTGHWLSHLLVEKMRQDGWRVHIYFDKSGINADAFDENFVRFYETKLIDTAPAAILALFVKVYGLDAEGGHDER